MASLEDIVAPAPLAPPRLSLLNSVTVVSVGLDGNGGLDTGPGTTARTIDDEPWRGAAITYTPEPCGGEGGTYDPGCGGPTVDVSGDKSTVKTAERFQAFGVFEPESCSNFGAAGVDTDARALRALDVDLPKQVEREWWKGTRAKAIAGQSLFNRWLARDVAEPTVGNPPVTSILKASVAQTPIRALAELEAAIASGRSGGRCVIHATRRTVTFWIAQHLLYRVGNVLLTVASDTIVVPGEGYDGSSPAGVVDATGDTDWAYATGPMVVFLGPVELVKPMSPEYTSTNRRTSIAKRQVAIAVDPCVFVGIKVTNS